MTVLDINDNTPSLSLPASQDVAVNSPAGFSIYSVFAIDPDFGDNGTAGLSYSVRGNANFEMDGQMLKNTYVCRYV